MISEKQCIVSDDRRLSEIFNEYFINVTKSLGLKPSIISTTTSLPEIIETFKDQLLKFHSASENEVRKVILNMDEKRRT